MPLRWNFSSGKRSPFTEPGSVSASVEEAEKKKPCKQWKKKFNGRLVEAEVQKHQEMHSLKSVHKCVYSFMHVSSLALGHGDQHFLKWLFC